MSSVDIYDGFGEHNEWWHKKVSADRKIRSAATIRLAGLILHNYNPAVGYIELAHRDIARRLRVSTRTVGHALSLLKARGWIQRLPGPSWLTARYTLGDGIR